MVQKPSKVINDITTIETFTNINGGGKAENHQINTDKYTKDAMNIAANSGMYLKNGNRQKDVLDTRQFIKSPLTGEVNTGIYLKKNTRNDLDTSRMIKTPLNVSATSGMAKFEKNIGISSSLNTISCPGEYSETQAAPFKPALIILPLY